MSGYNDKQGVLLTRILEKMCSGTVDETRFNILLENVGGVVFAVIAIELLVSLVLYLLLLVLFLLLLVLWLLLFLR